MHKDLPELIAYALTLPEASEHHPWGDIAIKVGGKKTFVFMSGGRSGTGCAITAKLPESGQAVLSVHEFASPAGYGLGKSGWVYACFEEGEDAPVELLKGWIDESWRAIAPKALVKAFSAGVQPR
ncbi:MmcQ/YjbR family DNA-binding protein [Alkalicaulis satelles]|uniref:MmcQ/YjbR family DNA-binding protein n=1 Tax=Alkalicaulis satelles TaxID=2609175 RepID=A0A5M6ZMJ6_9PROT|nr:MmcQ/YjbR family DNA-binding protein [Alkalicaulis satelles]KAA5805135.1 MmcQ/YjbR family DNA-binding protein [Alkalicaulis satelles]